MLLVSSGVTHSIMLALTKQRRIKSRSYRRPVLGSGVIEAVIALTLIIGSTFLAVVLLLNIGLATYDKEKLAYVADQASLYAISLSDRSTRDADVKSFVDNMLNQMGAKATNTTVTVKDVACSRWAAISVSVKSTLPTIMSTAFSSLVPQQLEVSDTSVAIKSPYATAYCLGAAPIGGKVTLALVNPTGDLPPDTLPAWSINLAFGLRKIR